MIYDIRSDEGTDFPVLIPFTPAPLSLFSPTMTAFGSGTFPSSRKKSADVLWTSEKYPFTSMKTCVLWLMLIVTDPPLNATMPALAMVWPAWKFSSDTIGDGGNRGTYRSSGRRR